MCALPATHMHDKAAFLRTLKDAVAGRPRRPVLMRGDVHTNTGEDYFSISKRGMKGFYQHCNKRYIHRCEAEYEFR